MESFVGTWKQTSADNLENFLKSVQSTELTKDALKAVLTKATSPELREVISVSGQEVTIKESLEGSTNQQVKEATIGQEIDFKYGSGEINKLMFTLEDGCLVETLVGKTTKKIVRKVEGNTMTHTLTHNGVEATRTLTKA